MAKLKKEILTEQEYEELASEFEYDISERIFRCPCGEEYLIKVRITDDSERYPMYFIKISGD